MESINQVTLSGQITGPITEMTTNEGVGVMFGLETFQMYWKDGKKVKEPEIHIIRLKDASAIMNAFQEGKPVVVIGRLKYSSKGTYINANHINFPERKNIA